MHHNQLRITLAISQFSDKYSFEEVELCRVKLFPPKIVNTDHHEGFNCFDMISAKDVLADLMTVESKKKC